MSRPPPKHYISSMSEDGDDHQQQGKKPLPPPPPPPPPPVVLETVNDSNSPPLSGNENNTKSTTTTTNNNNKSSPPSHPPSVLRTSTQNNSGSSSKNSVAFSRIMDNLITTTNTNSPTRAAANAAAAATAAANNANTITNNNRQHISLDTVISSQFENEAETHILAALEMEEEEDENNYKNIDVSLAGEGIDETNVGEGGIEGLEDYSDDDDDEDDNAANRNRTWSNDSFLRKFKEQNELPQYQMKMGLYSDIIGGGSGGGGSSELLELSPEKSSLVPPPPPHHHRRYSSNYKRASDLPSVPDDSALEYDTDNDPFLEGINAGSHDKMNNIAKEAVAATTGATIGGDNNKDTTNDEHENADDTDNNNTIIEEEINLLDHTSGEIDNMNFMANRLRSLQRRSLGSSTRSDENNNKNNNGAEQTSGDRLIDALNSVDSSKNKSFVSKMKSEYANLIVPKLPIFERRISRALLLLIFPCLAVAALLFYIFDNPLAGETGTSISWWILFLGVRQPLIFELARAGEVFWVEIFALRSRLFNMAVGPYVSLAFIQSKGWPYIITFWAGLDFVFLYGSHQFPKHWLYWQHKLDLFNAANPVEGITDAPEYLQILLAMIFVGVMVSLKRLCIAIYLGRREVTHFGSELEELMAKMILIGEVANLARDIEKKRSIFEGSMSPNFYLGDEDKLVRFKEYMQDENSNSSVDVTPSPHGIQRKTLSVTPTDGSALTPKSPASVSQGTSPGQSPPRPRHSPPRPPTMHSPPRPRASSSDGVYPTSSSTANVKLMYLLSEWEEPETASKKSQATVRDLLEFKKAVAQLDDKYPLSHAFGNAKTREACVESSQAVYDRLMLSVSNDCSALPFSILSVIAMDDNGEFIVSKIKSLLRLFRPDRQGNLIRLDFVKSVDTVYKQLRLLRASIANSAQIDYAFERIINCFFYFFLTIIAVAILGIDIWAVVISMNTFFLGFSFLFGSAASNYFEGLLLIFVRRPYDIGDRIATSNPKSDTNPNGSSTWYVESVTLFTTTARFATTNEVATYSNGSLAVLRIINANRSAKAIVAVLIKFGLETPFNKITVFKTATENFIKARPREWISLVGFRATRVEADIGYIEYKIVVQHRESWQNIGPVLQSKADLSSFCLEATKKLDMKYESPPMPVNLSTSGNLDMSGIFQGESDELKGDSIGAEGDGRVAPKSLSAEDLQEVANLFEIRKKQK